jgi:hypothetical protein
MSPLTQPSAPPRGTYPHHWQQHPKAALVQEKENPLSEKASAVAADSRGDNCVLVRPHVYAACSMSRASPLPHLLALQFIFGTPCMDGTGHLGVLCINSISALHQNLPSHSPSFLRFLLSPRQSVSNRDRRESAVPNQMQTPSLHAHNLCKAAARCPTPGTRSPLSARPSTQSARRGHRLQTLRVMLPS